MVCRINCSDITQAKQLHQQLAEQLGFPRWYGHNLDALHDCLTELDQPTWVILENWNPEAPFAGGFEAVFQDACQDCYLLTVKFE